MEQVKDIIKQIHAQWKQAKAHLAERCALGGNKDMADKLAACEMFTGGESLSDLAELFTSAQGIEFCLAAKFPTLATLRLFKRFGVERYGVYIDAGDITLDNPRRAILIGRTTARVNYTDKSALHNLTLLRGASAVVNASGWAVVGLTSERGCKLIKNVTGNAVILC